MSQRTASRSYVLALLAAIALAGCSVQNGPQEPDTPDEPTQERVPHCVEGHWLLDVADYSAQAYAYVVGANGIPIEDWQMYGSGSLVFDEVGASSIVDLTTTGTIVVPGVSVPLDVRSAYEGSGRWYPGLDEGSIDFEDWANVPADDVVIDPDDPSIPVIDFTDMAGAGIQCSANELIIQGPEAPISARWTR